MHHLRDRGGHGRGRTSPAVVVVVLLIVLAAHALAPWFVAGSVGATGPLRVLLAVGVALLLALTIAALVIYRAHRR